MIFLSEHIWEWHEQNGTWARISENIMANPFKVGDKVKCIEVSNSGYPGILGKIYTVTDAIDNEHIRLKSDGSGEDFSLGCQHKRFELYTGTEVDKWFDSHLQEPQKKKERVPDELDWEKHKAFMRSLR